METSIRMAALHAPYVDTQRSPGPPLDTATWARLLVEGLHKFEYCKSATRHLDRTPFAPRDTARIDDETAVPNPVQGVALPFFELQHATERTGRFILAGQESEWKPLRRSEGSARIPAVSGNAVDVGAEP